MLGICALSGIKMFLLNTKQDYMLKYRNDTSTLLAERFQELGTFCNDGTFFAPIDIEIPLRHYKLVIVKYHSDRSNAHINIEIKSKVFYRTNRQTVFDIMNTCADYKASTCDIFHTKPAITGGSVSPEMNYYFFKGKMRTGTRYEELSRLQSYSHRNAEYLVIVNINRTKNSFPQSVSCMNDQSKVVLEFGNGRIISMRGEKSKLHAAGKLKRMSISVCSYEFVSVTYLIPTSTRDCVYGHGVYPDLHIQYNYIKYEFVDDLHIMYNNAIIINKVFIRISGILFCEIELIRTDVHVRISTGSDDLQKYYSVATIEKDQLKMKCRKKTRNYYADMYFRHACNNIVGCSGINMGDEYNVSCKEDHSQSLQTMYGTCTIDTFLRNAADIVSTANRQCRLRVP